MCDPVTIGALALSAAGAATSAYATSQQQNKQNDIAAAGILKQGQLQKQAENDVGQTVNTLNASNASTQAKTAQQLNAYRSALLQAQPLSAAASPGVPGASKAFGAAQTASSSSAADYVNKIATSAATTQGTQLERVNEGQSMADTATKLGVLGQQSGEQSYLTKLQVSATQANPWVKGLGMLMQGAGMGLGMASGAGLFSSGQTSSAMGMAGADQAALAASKTADTAGMGINSAFGAGANVAPPGFGADGSIFGAGTYTGAGT